MMHIYISGHVLSLRDYNGISSSSITERAKIQELMAIATHPWGGLHLELRPTLNFLHPGHIAPSH